MPTDTANGQLDLPGLSTPREVFRKLRNYLAGQFVGATRDETLLDELLKVLFCKLYIEAGMVESPPSTVKDSVTLAQEIRGVFRRVRDDFPDIYEPGVELLLDPAAIATVWSECSFSLIASQSDPIGDAFEVFAGAESRGRSGQFFTPRTVTDWLVEAVAPEMGDRVLDPACGAGGFLTSVIRYMGGRGASPSEVASNVTASFVGIDKDEYLARLCRLHVALLSGGHPQVHVGDSISLSGLDSAHVDIAALESGFDVVLTNPPFGKNIVSGTAETLRGFQLARKWRADVHGELCETSELASRVPPQVIFVERCVRALKPGGRLGMVLPESVLSNKSYRHVVAFLRERMEIRAVVGMPEALFKTSGKGGTHTKTCLLIARKPSSRASRSKSVFMAEALWCGQDSRARQIAKDDLPRILGNFKSLARNRRPKPSHLGFTLSHDAIRYNILCPRYYDPEPRLLLDDLRDTHDIVRFQELADAGVVEVRTGDEVGKLAYGTGDIPFIRTSDLSNWELKADAKHGLERSVYESLRRKQDVQPLDILMVRDGTYLIGTCALITEHDTEIVYQSHIFKIRIAKNDYGLNPHLLLAILSSAPVQRQIKAYRFTQDIIDTLGDRLFELDLPIPKDAGTRDRVTHAVMESINSRAAARERAREARVLVAAAG